MGGEFRSQLLGNTGFIKLDAVLSPKHYLSTRLSTSRYYGANNVFFDPASPITNYSMSENGEERVSTESAMASLTSSLSLHATSHLRLQFSRDLQDSSANSSDVQTRTDGIIEGFGPSSILPRRTREHRLQIADTVSLESRTSAVPIVRPFGSVLRALVRAGVAGQGGGPCFLDRAQPDAVCLSGELG